MDSTIRQASVHSHNPRPLNRRRVDSTSSRVHSLSRSNYNNDDASALTGDSVSFASSASSSTTSAPLLTAQAQNDNKTSNHSQTNTQNHTTQKNRGRPPSRRVDDDGDDKLEGGSRHSQSVPLPPFVPQRPSLARRESLQSVASSELDNLSWCQQSVQTSVSGRRPPPPTRNGSGTIQNQQQQHANRTAAPTIYEFDTESTRPLTPPCLLRTTTQSSVRMEEEEQGFFLEARVAAVAVSSSKEDYHTDLEDSTVLCLASSNSPLLQQQQYPTYNSSGEHEDSCYINNGVIESSPMPHQQQHPPFYWSSFGEYVRPEATHSPSLNQTPAKWQPKGHCFQPFVRRASL